MKTLNYVHRLALGISLVSAASVGAADFNGSAPLNCTPSRCSFRTGYCAGAFSRGLNRRCYPVIDRSPCGPAAPARAVFREETKNGPEGMNPFRSVK